MSSSFISFCPGCSDSCFPEYDDSRDNLPTTPTYIRLNREQDRDPIDSKSGRLRRRYSKNQLPESAAATQRKTQALHLVTPKRRPGTPIPAPVEITVPQPASSSTPEPCPYRNWAKRYSTLLGLLKLEADESSEQSIKLIGWIKEDLAALCKSSEKERQYLSYDHLQICIKYHVLKDSRKWKSMINIMSPVDWLKSYFQNLKYFTDIGINTDVALDIFSNILKHADEDMIETWLAGDMDLIFSEIADDISTLENMDKESYQKIFNLIQSYKKK